MDEIVNDEHGWYFWMRDRVCRIGPYPTEGLCRGDWERYRETGRISLDPAGKVGACCSECEEP